MGRSKKIVDSIRLSVVMSKDQGDFIKKMAIRMSVNECRQVTVSEAIRMAVEEVYPVPNDQSNMFQGGDTAIISMMS